MCIFHAVIERICTEPRCVEFHRAVCIFKQSFNLQIARISSVKKHVNVYLTAIRVESCFAGIPCTFLIGNAVCVKGSENSRSCLILAIVVREAYFKIMKFDGQNITLFLSADMVNVV